MQYSGKYSRRGPSRQMPYTERGRYPFCNMTEDTTFCANECDNSPMPREESVHLKNNGSDCCDHYHNEWCDRHFSLAMAYIYPQEFDDLYEADEALCHGTLFRDLDMPFYGTRKRC